MNPYESDLDWDSIYTAPVRTHAWRMVYESKQAQKRFPTRATRGAVKHAAHRALRRDLRRILLAQTRRVQ